MTLMLDQGELGIFGLSLLLLVMWLFRKPISRELHVWKWRFWRWRVICLFPFLVFILFYGVVAFTLHYGWWVILGL